MKLFNLIPTKILSQQARKPSGLIGRYVMPILFKGNADLNNFVQESLELTKTDDILEIGFGPGKLLNEIALIANSVAGIDFSAAMVAKASKINQQHIKNNKLRIQQGECKNLPYANNFFDKVCSVNTLYFWDDPQVYLQEIFRVTKIGGKIVLGFRNKEQMNNLDLSTDVFNTYSLDEVKKLLLNAGFSNINITEKIGKPFISYCAIASKVA
ncbi:MAG: class I SAM-dependent methyltransferase [Candidatus Marithrix sp.]